MIRDRQRARARARRKEPTRRAPHRSRREATGVSAGARHPGEAEAGLVGQPVLLAAVAATATRHDVVPAVRPTPAPRDDMIDVLGLRTAVLAAMPVTNEHRAAGDGDAGLVGDADVVDQADDGRFGEPRPGGVEVLAGAVQQLGLVGEHQDEGSSRGDDRERFERRIQNERPADHLSRLVVPQQASGGGYRNCVRRRDTLHQSSHATTSSGPGRRRAVPVGGLHAESHPPGSERRRRPVTPPSAA